MLFWKLIVGNPPRERTPALAARQYYCFTEASFIFSQSSTLLYVNWTQEPRCLMVYTINQSDAVTMNEDLKEAFVLAAIETFKKLSECPEIKTCRIYTKPEKSLSPTHQRRTPSIRNNSRAVTSARPLPFRWILVVSAQRSARRSVLKVRGYRHGKVSESWVLMVFLPFQLLNRF